MARTHPFTRCNTPSRTWSGPTRTSSPSERRFRSSSAASATVSLPGSKAIQARPAQWAHFPAKLGWMRLRLSRPVPGELRNATVSFKAGKWCVSIQTEREVEQPVPHATSAIGIDVGIARFATMSDGTFVAPLNSFKKHEARLRRCQRAMSRKVKFSNNWKKPRPESSASMRASPMLAATTCTRPRPRSAKPRDGVYRGLAGSEYVQVGGRQHRCAWQERSGQVRSE